MTSSARCCFNLRSSVKCYLTRRCCLLLTRPCPRGHCRPKALQCSLQVQTASRTHISLFHAVPTLMFLCAAHDLTVLCRLCSGNALKQPSLDRTACLSLQALLHCPKAAFLTYPTNPAGPMRTLSALCRHHISSAAAPSQGIVPDLPHTGS